MPPPPTPHASNGSSLFALPFIFCLLSLWLEPVSLTTFGKSTRHRFPHTPIGFSIRKLETVSSASAFQKDKSERHFSVHRLVDWPNDVERDIDLGRNVIHVNQNSHRYERTQILSWETGCVCGLIVSCPTRKAEFAGRTTSVHREFDRSKRGELGG